jgi:hypothetical protein
MDQKLVTNNGVTGPRIYGGDLLNAPQEALTGTSGGSAGALYDAGTIALINNLVARVDDLEDKLQTLGLLK